MDVEKTSDSCNGKRINTQKERRSNKVPSPVQSKKIRVSDRVPKYVLSIRGSHRPTSYSFTYIFTTDTLGFGPDVSVTFRLKPRLCVFKPTFVLLEVCFFRMTFLHILGSLSLRS